MAIYHLSIKIISRGKGKCSVASAAYRAAEKILNEREGTTHDYTRKKGVQHTEIMLPSHAPAEYADRAVLWNAVEKIERANNAQLAREIEVALPVELTAEQNLSLVREYVKNNFVNAGMCADFAIHDKKDGNPHAHIMLTMRPIEPSGKWGAKQRKVYHLDEDGNKIYDPVKRLYKCSKEETTDWNEQTNAEDWREKWGQAVNALLAKENHVDRIDHRSYKRQGVDKIPTIHLGISASQMERKGIKTERGNHNRKVDTLNKEIKQLKARIKKCNDWIYSQPIDNPPSMMSVLTAISKGEKTKTHYQQIYDLKAQAKILLFLNQNNISDISHLANTIKRVNNGLQEVSDRIKKVDRRLESLDFNIEQAENRKKHKAIYEQYVNIQLSLKDKLLKRDPQAEFYNKHFNEISDYQSADEYLKKYLNGKVKTAPLKKWKAEREELTAERVRLGEKFYTLKDETRSVEMLRKGVDVLIKEQERQSEIEEPQKQYKSYGLE